MLFGNGDGGGGPLSTMIDRLERLKSVSGLPSKVEFGEPSKFYENLEKSSRDLVKWKGELYFELHRGTYTTQAKIKQYNRKCEYLLQRVEFLYSRLFIQGKCKNPKTELDRLWKLVLLNQFHDVLPGSSIEMVYDDAKVFYKDVEASCNSLINQAIELMSTAEKGTFLYNTTCWNLSSRVVELEKNDLGCIAGEVVIGANGKGIIVGIFT